MNKIEEIAAEFIEHGNLLNTLNLLEKAACLKELQDRHQCDFWELIEGMKKSTHAQIDSNYP